MMVCKRHLLSNIQILDIYTYISLYPQESRTRIYGNTPKEGFKTNWVFDTPVTFEGFSPKHPMELVYIYLHLYHQHDPSI